MDSSVKTFEAVDDSEMLSDINLAAEQALDWLGLSSGRATPGQAIGAIDVFLADLISGQREAPEDADSEEQAFVLGCLWGQQLVAALSWRWIKVKFDSATFVIGVASPEQKLVIYPFLYLLQCLEDERPVAIYQSFRVLTETGRVPELPANTLEDVMDHVDPA